MTTYVTAMDVQGSFSYVSPQIQVLLGYTPEEWLANVYLRCIEDSFAAVLSVSV